MHEIDPTLPKGVMDEYLRRNMLHASSVGAEANAKTALERVSGWKNSPKWLVEALQGIIDRCEKVAPEMAKHRDEIEVYRKKPEPKHDWHYDSLGLLRQPRKRILTMETRLIDRLICKLFGHSFRSIWRTSVDCDDGGDRLDTCQRCGYRKLHIKMI